MTLEISAADVPRAEALLTLAGTEAIVLRDAADEPVFEPEPSTAPLWPRVTLHALFAMDVDVSPLRELLALTFPQAAVSAETLPESAWQPGLEQTVKARPIGTRL